MATVTKLLSSPRPLPLWRPWLPREEEEVTGRQRERTDTVSAGLPAGAPLFLEKRQKSSLMAPHSFTPMSLHPDIPSAPSQS